MGYKLDPFPTWTLEELRPYLGDCIRKHLGSEDRDRLKALDIAMYIPPNLEASAMAAGGEDVGPLVQVAGFLAHAGAEQEGKAFRFVFPHRMPWSAIDRFAKQVAINFKNIVRVMRIEEKRGGAVKLAVSR